MAKKFSVSIYLDTRREKKNGVFPVKLRVYSPYLNKTKYYRTSLEYSANDFKKIWIEKPRTKEHKEEFDKLDALRVLAKENSKDLQSYSFQKLEKKLGEESGDDKDVFYYCNQYIEKLKKEGRIGTAKNYEESMRSWKKYNGIDVDKMSFHEVTVEWLEGYENHIVQVNNGSKATVGIYLRPLRCLFNNAIRANEIPAEVYPFGENKYEIPSISKIKRAFDGKQLEKLLNAIPKSNDEQKAKDFWFFSFACNGMNIMDIAYLKYKDLEDDTLVFYRYKTKKTSKKNQKQIIAYLNPATLAIIKKYGNEKTNPDQYIFNIISDDQDKEEQRQSVKNFTRFINTNIKKIAKTSGMSERISCITARHSFTTQVIRKKGKRGFVIAQESLGHSSQKTTENYFAGFEDKETKSFLKNIMKFK